MLMRSLILQLVAVMTLWAVTPALAAPTCQTRFGETARCETTGAMPVGWTLPANRRPAAARDADSLKPAQWCALFALVGGLFAMIALMPPFDGRLSSDWGEQQPDSDDPD